MNFRLFYSLRFKKVNNTPDLFYSILYFFGNCFARRSLGEGGKIVSLREIPRSGKNSRRNRRGFRLSTDIFANGDF